jgi:hypothetical protein
MSGPQVIEVVVIDSDIDDTDQAKGEPDVQLTVKYLEWYKPSTVTGMVTLQINSFPIHYSISRLGRLSEKSPRHLLSGDCHSGLDPESNAHPGT